MEFLLGQLHNAVLCLTCKFSVPSICLVFLTAGKGKKKPHCPCSQKKYQHDHFASNWTVRCSSMQTSGNCQSIERSRREAHLLLTIQVQTLPPVSVNDFWVQKMGLWSNFHTDIDMQFRNFLLPDENFCNSQKKDVGMMLLDNSNWLKWTAVIGSLFSVLYIIN